MTTAKQDNGRRRVCYVFASPLRLSETFVREEVAAVRRVASLDETPWSVVSVSRGVVSAGNEWDMSAYGFDWLSFVRGLRNLSGGLAYRARNAYLVGRLMRRTRQLRPDWIHTHFLTPNGQVAAELARQLNCGVSAMAHAADYRSSRAIRATSSVGGALQLVTISEAARAEMVTLGYGSRALGAFIVRPATAPLHYQERSVARSEMRVITIARLVPKKGLDRSVRAMEEVAKQNEDTNFTYEIVGDGPMRHELETQCLNVQQPNLRIEMRGALEHGDALDRLNNSDLALLLCQTDTGGDQDGLPVFLLEAAALGIPVVASPVSAVADLLSAERASMVSSEGAATDRISVLVRDGSAYMRASRAMRRRYEEEFEPELQARRLLNGWNQLVQTR